MRANWKIIYLFGIAQPQQWLLQFTTTLVIYNLFLSPLQQRKTKDNGILILLPIHLAKGIGPLLANWIATIYLFSILRPYSLPPLVRMAGKLAFAN